MFSFLNSLRRWCLDALSVGTPTPYFLQLVFVVDENTVLLANLQLPGRDKGGCYEEACRVCV